MMLQVAATCSLSKTTRMLYLLLRSLRSPGCRVETIMLSGLTNSKNELRRFTGTNNLKEKVAANSSAAG